MPGSPARKSCAYLACVFAMLTWACAAAVPGTEVPLKALQQLGTQIKLATDQAEAGHYPTASSLAVLQHSLDVQRSSAENADQTLQHKLAAVSLLLEKLQYLSAHPAPVQARPATTRASIDVEAVTSRHGASCATALGISESLRVMINLAQAGSGQSDAWFRFEPAAPGHFRFTTDTSGADPAIEVFQSCAAGAVSLAANDDTLGLDAAVSVAASDRSGLIVHLTNAGSAGSVTLGSQGLDGTLRGKITDAATGHPIENAQISVFDNSLYSPQTSTSSDANGNYALSVDAGSYYVRVGAGQYLSEVYPEAACPYNNNYYNIAACTLDQAQLVAVAAGATVAGIDVALGAGQRISGVVRDALNQPVTSALVYLDDAAGNELSGTNVDSFGRYSFATIPAGTYKMHAQSNGYGSQMFDHVTCGGPLLTQCDLTRASMITVGSEDAGGINFNLPQLATIQGNVSGPGFPAGYANSQVSVLDVGGNLLVQPYTDANGHYIAGPLAIGTYYVFVSAGGFFSQIFNGVDCAQDCFASIAAATPVAITQNGQVGAADFHLTALPSVHGHIQDAVSGSPLANVSVQASTYPPATFAPVSSTLSDGNGDYTLLGTPAGSFYLWAQSPDHIDQIYSGIACEAYVSNYYPYSSPCTVTGATTLTIMPGQTPPTFDFALQASSSISGHAVINAGPGSDLGASVQINVYDDAGNSIASANTDALGNYLVSDLTAGTYFVSAGTYYYYNSSYVTQVWKSIDCPDNCAPTQGTPVIVGQGNTVADIDFTLARRDAVVGKVTDANGAALGGVIIDLFDATTHSYLSTSATDASGFYATPTNTGSSVFVATEVNGNFIDQVYSGILCPRGAAYFGLCPLDNATAVILGNFGAQPHIVDFVLQPLPNEIFASSFD
jgi:hypothetical protein